tara:strand:+ start:3133 stop:3873 length:741 start_codon:yes stop_codon:yes gene_type:complete
MAKHLSYRSKNPALSSKIFSESIVSDSSDVMTIQGTVDKTAIALSILLVAGYFGYTSFSPVIMMGGFIGGFIVAIVTIFKRTWAPYTVPIYAVLEGLALGGISFFYNSLYEGIVLQAITITVCILLSLLFAYKTRIIKATENFKLGVFAATGGIFLIYVVDLVMSFFGTGISVLNIENSSNFSILFSLGVVVIASLNLVIDFDFIEEGAEKGAPKYMEWYGTFGLLITLVWLYLEILRMLAKMRNR